MIDKRTYKVVCPIDGFTVRDMPVDFVPMEGEAHRFPLPTAGCDCMLGEDVCDMCRVKIVLYLHDNPEARADLPIVLKGF